MPLTSAVNKRKASVDAASANAAIVLDTNIITHEKSERKKAAIQHAKKSSRNTRRDMHNSNRSKLKQSMRNKPLDELRNEKLVNKEKAQSLRSKLKDMKINGTSTKMDQKNAIIEFRKAQKTARLVDVVTRNAVKRKEILDKIASGQEIVPAMDPTQASVEIKSHEKEISAIKADVTQVEDLVIELSQVDGDSSSKLILLNKHSSINLEITAEDDVDSELLLVADY
jgi:hypothetical protein